MTLCELAGFDESPNKSLINLEKVMKRLSARKKAKFGKSTLTRLLESKLSLQNRICVLVVVSPMKGDALASKSALKFA